MKVLVFLVVVALVVWVVAWRVRKTQAEEAIARRKAFKKRKKRQDKAMTPEIDMTWPVIVKPVRGENAPLEDEEPSMTSIEFEPSEKAAAEQGK